MVQNSSFVWNILDMEPGSLISLDSLESRLLGLPQVSYTQGSYFSDGIWIRALSVPGGALIMGHEHKRENLNILAKGEKLLVIGGRIERMVAPYCVLSGPGVRKVGLIVEEMMWYSVHHNPDNIRDEDELEAMFYRKSEGWQRHAQMVREAEKKLLEVFPLTGLGVEK
jgi:hypothetical protein